MLLLAWFVGYFLYFLHFKFLELLIKVKAYPVCWSGITSVVKKLFLAILQITIYWTINVTIDMGDINEEDCYNIYEQIKQWKRKRQQREDLNNAIEFTIECLFILCTPFMFLAFLSQFK